MHIEPGYVALTKVALANISAIGLLGYYARDLLPRPTSWLRAGLAAIFFSLFMQSFHMPVGPSELHFVGAMAMYLTLGFIPTLFGFAVGLGLQGLLFEPTDLVHLGVNSLSLIVPLIVLHKTLGAKIGDVTKLRWRDILKMDGMYYTGLSIMVGFWLMIGDVATPVSAWAAWASSYLAVVAFEPLFTYASLRLLARYRDNRIVTTCFAIKAA
uniref:ABC-type Co2+ transport system, permease component n=1 Tax=Candidatus Kentrum sp. TUN TaxID=2126343 RepID=A0A450ZIX3_9GAMM|nr:MAG: ABC-type Co2+ transport system, permease component [Candidatus Kentron sp. TUN]VFK54081.1 MAG: ABC-type Co2+ transport system, permease component [Candidatus Kentron sp. TUN]VFK55278.1 MAG: ABC-type Co2+ transport system, permease component [Candidatus Kentron sp. TUN]